MAKVKTPMTKKSLTMAELAKEAGRLLVPIKVGEIVEVEVLKKTKERLLVDVLGLRLGIIPAREFSLQMAEVEVGEKVLASLLALENDDGCAVLSLRRADRERVLLTLREKAEAKESVMVKVKEANSGGLVVLYGGIEGFLPVSQLSLNHAPRPLDANQGRVLSQLKSLIGQTLRTQIITFEPQIGKIIFSEKAAGDPTQEALAKKLKIGQKIEGRVTGIVDFGLFVDIGQLEGLVHISEVSWERIPNLKERYNVGDKVKVEVIAIEGPRVSLSIKRLLPDPWAKVAKKYKKGAKVFGKVTRVTPFGGFVRLDEQIEGLVHISELGQDVKDAASVIKEGERYPFEIVTVDQKARKIALRLLKARSLKKKVQKSSPKALKKKPKAAKKS